MATLRDKVHDLGSYYNKISMGTIVTRELLSSIDFKKISAKELKSKFKETIANLKIFEGSVMEANKTMDEMERFIQEKTDSDTDIPLEIRSWHDKIGSAAMIRRKALLNNDPSKLSEAQLRKIISQTVAALNEIGEWVVKADKIFEHLKPVLYNKVGGDSVIVL